MGSQVKSVAKHHVAERANFNADVFINVLLNQIRKQEKLESMTNALCVQQNCIMEIGDTLIVGFTRMEESWHLVSFRVFVVLRGQNLRHEICNARRELLFVNHVKPSNKIRICFFADLNMLNHLSNVGVPDDLEPSEDQHKLEVRNLLLCLVNNFLNNFKFF
jgi:hypothetical protein